MENEEKLTIAENNFLVIDGNSIMNRAFYGLKILATKDGLYTNAVYGFLNIFYMMIEKLKPSFVAVAFDLSAPTFRHKMYSEYKAGRRTMPDELRPQMSLIKDVLKAMNIPILEIEGYEADDILGTISAQNTKRDIHTYILTGDRDSFQLISDFTTVILPTTKFGKTEYTYFTPEALNVKYGIRPEQVVDVKALMGDTSDNIPGVPGIGEKTAYPLIQKYTDIEYIYEHLKELDITPSVMGKLEANEESARQSKVLATINLEAPLDSELEQFEFIEPDYPELIKIFTRLEFKKFIEKYQDKIEGKGITTDKAEEFFKEYANTQIVQVDNINGVLDDIKSITEDNKVILTILEEEYLKEALIMSFNNKIYIIQDKQELQKEVLNKLLICSAKIIGYNIKKVIRKCLEFGIKNFNSFVSDIMIAYYLLHPTESNYSIENIAYKILDVPMPQTQTEKKKNIQTSLFDMLEQNPSILEITEEDKRRIYYILKAIEICNESLLKELGKNSLTDLYYNIELPLVEVLADIEYNGMYVNKERLEAFAKELTNSIEVISKKIYELAKEEFNINSPQQLGKILFEKLEIPYPKKTKSSYSTDKETLESIEGEYEIIEAVLEYRTLSKLKSTYAEALMEQIKADGRIHTTFMQTVTQTGRLSSIEPNLQNIPVKTELGGQIRDCFVSEKENSVIVDADYSQIELRVLAHMAQDKALIEGFKQHEDIHSITASQVFNIPLAEVTKEHRSKAKAVNFGIVYGISEYGLAKNIKSTRPDAARYMRNYLAHYKGIADYMENIIDIAREQGYVKTIFGRIRTVPELKSANYLTRTFGQRIAMNMPIQGSAADIMKIAMIKAYNKIKENNLNSKIIMQVHDELLVEAPLEEVELVKNILRESMEKAAELSVPLEIDINVGKSWLEAK
ncbi:MAG: DNA polymerase I [Clostridia bacterium]|nr:DNA polymerase I [Clostridia bacterium]